jgi:phospholipase/carboxylesterase
MKHKTFLKVLATRKLSEAKIKKLSGNGSIKSKPFIAQTAKVAMILSMFFLFCTPKNDFKTPQKTVNVSTISTIKDSFSLKHLVRQTTIKSDSKPPVLILLHGYGSNEDDLFSLSEAIDGQWMVVSARGTMQSSPDTYNWYTIDRSTGKMVYDAKEVEKSCLVIGKFIEEVCQNYGADASRVVVAGFSQGAMMSAVVGLTMPEKVSGFGMFGGRILEEIKTQIAPLEQRKHLNAIVLHGIADERVPIQNARDCKANLEKWGIKHQYLEFAGEGHTISEGMLDAFVGWMKTL